MSNNAEKLRALGIELRKTTGTCKVKCPRCSHARRPQNQKEPCLSVDIDRGLYRCHNNDCDFRGTVSIERVPDKQYTKPPQWSNVTALSDKAVKWFASRGISQQTLLKARIGEGIEYMHEGKTGRPAGPCNTIQFPHFRNNILVNIQYRSGDKGFKSFTGAELIFFNLDAIANSEECYITEGHMDCLSLIEIGIDNAVSVPNGANAGNLEYLDNCYQWLENKKKIILVTDDDEPGRALRDELIRRLGAERCWIVNYGQSTEGEWMKDANEVMEKVGAIQLGEVIANAKPCPLRGVKTVDDLMLEVIDLHAKGLQPGDQIGIRDEMAKELVSFAPGQLSVITGIPSHGKGSTLDWMMAKLAILHKWKFGIFSPENHPTSLHLSKFIEIFVGKPFTLQYGPDRITQEDINQCIGYMREKFFFIVPDDENFTIDNILEHALMLVRRHGIKGLVIDPWNTLEHQLADKENISQYVGKVLLKIINFDRRNGVHTFVVAHPTKMKKANANSKKYPVPNLYDISSSSQFYDKADIGMSVYRDFEKNITRLHILKVKHKHMGYSQTVSEFVYDYKTSRYYPLNGFPDKSNWITNGIVEQPPPPEIAFDGIVHNNSDETPF